MANQLTLKEIETLKEADIETKRIIAKRKQYNARELTYKFIFLKVLKEMISEALSPAIVHKNAIAIPYHLMTPQQKQYRDINLYGSH